MPPLERTETAQTETDIHDVIARWSAGERDAAVRALLELYESQAPPDRYRPYSMSEEEFIALPQAKREALRQEMADVLAALNRVSRELHRRSEGALAAGDITAAEKYVKVMKQLGLANTGPEVTLLVDLLGQAILKRADEGLAALREVQNATPPAGPTTSPS